MSGEGWDDPEMFADLGELGELPELSWFEGGGYIGIRPLEMTPELRTHFGAPKEAGVFVGTVEKDSPAAKAGLQVGDIVTSADGEKVERKRDLVRTIRRKKEGDTVKIELVRDRAAKTLTVTVAEREDSRVRVGDFGPGMRRFHMRHPRGVPPVPPVPPAPPAARFRRFPRRSSSGWTISSSGSTRSRAGFPRNRTSSLGFGPLQNLPQGRRRSGGPLFFERAILLGPTPLRGDGSGDRHEHARRDAARVLRRPGLHRARDPDLQDPARA